jgi:4-diphosphocytidyl-2-C-methyl-D-erythritol kinase
VILFPNCKINLGLRVTGKRDDGYHTIETVFYPLPLKDAAEITVGNQRSTDEFELRISGLPIPGDTTNNLCHKAWELIKNDHPEIGPVQMNLLKAIPTGAGLGGGSSDGAHTLLLLDQLFQLNLSRQQLIAYALKLGSDCPFFILNKPCIGTGRGEIMQEIDLNLKGYYFVLVNPGVHISTAWAFEKLDLNKEAGQSLQDIIALPAEDWKGTLRNDFEEPVFEEFESLKLIKEELYNAGAVYASLTGTGSCVYGLFKEAGNPDLHKISDHYTVYSLKQNR